LKVTGIGPLLCTKKPQGKKDWKKEKQSSEQGNTRGPLGKEGVGRGIMTGGTAQDARTLTSAIRKRRPKPNPSRRDFVEGHNDFGRAKKEEGKMNPAGCQASTGGVGNHPM